MTESVNLLKERIKEIEKNSYFTARQKTELIKENKDILIKQKKLLKDYERINERLNGGFNIINTEK